MTRQRVYKYLIRGGFALALLLLAGFGALTLWVVTGPRSLGALTPYIESALAPPGADYQVKIAGAELVWDGWLHPVGIRIKNLDVLDGKDVAIAHFPEVGVRLYIHKLLMGKVEPKSIELLNPTARLVEDARGDITSFGFAGGDKATATPIGGAFVLLTSEEGDNPITHLKSFIIRGASLTVEDSKGRVFLSSPAASMEIVRGRGKATGKFAMPLRFDGKRSEIDVKFTVDGGKRQVMSNIAFSDVPSGVLHALAPAQQWMEGVRVPLSGRANMTADFDADISAIDFNLDTGAGSIDVPGQFERALEVRHIKLAGSLTDHLATFTVRQGLLDFGTHALNFNAVARKTGADYGVDGFASTANIPVDDVHLYWPLKLSPHSRHWVTTHVSGGKVASANVTLHFKPGEFRLKDTPDAAVTSDIALKGAAIAYKPGDPAITDIDGTVRFTGRTMDAKLASARYLSDTRITAARVRFPDFYPDDVRLLIDMDVDTSAKDVQRFLALPDLNKAAKLNITPDIAGHATGNAKLDFIAFSENGKDDVGANGRINYSVNANLENVAQKRFLGKRDVADATMKLDVDNKGVKLSGKARINDVPMGIDLTSSFGKGGETTYIIKTDMPVARLADFSLPELNFAHGTMGVNATFISSDNTEKANVTLDLTDTAISLPQHGFEKKQGDAETLKLSTEELPSGNTLVRSFALEGVDFAMEGSAEYDKGAQDFKRFSLAPMRFGRQDLESISYEKSDNTVHISAKGRSFDASPYLSASSGKDTALGYKIDLQTDRLILGDRRALGDVSVQADCPPDACRSVAIHAKLADGTPFRYAIEGGKLEAGCDNAGELARVLGIFDYVSGGKMAMSGGYDAGNLQGMLEVKDYAIKHAPVMTKIFTIASLTGIVDTLRGTGIYFDRLSAPFVYHKGILILKDAKAHGPALGLTADGVVDTNKSTLDLTGLLVPSYTLNALVGHIPFLGDMIMGGAGKGLVALSYGVHGDMKDPSVRVNPLSVLTPGFLRDVFHIFDKPAPNMEAIEAAQKKAAGTMPAENAPAAPAPIQAVPDDSDSDTKLPSMDELKK